MLTKLDTDLEILIDIQCGKINLKISVRRIKTWSSKILRLQAPVTFKWMKLESRKKDFRKNWSKKLGSKKCKLNTRKWWMNSKRKTFERDKWKKIVRQWAAKVQYYHTTKTTSKLLVVCSRHLPTTWEKWKTGQKTLLPI